jgi:hypothetical protein
MLRPSNAAETMSAISHAWAMTSNPLIAPSTTQAPMKARAAFA